MKEKIWMDKLIELLNKYEQEEWCWRLKYWKLHNKYYDDYDQKDEEIRLISKWYGFIKWLVENDKIDFDNRDLKDRFMNEFERYPQFQNNTNNREFNVNGLLMLLSISNSPIEDLILYLK